MKGSTKVSLGYSQYSVTPTVTAFAGSDTQNDETPTIDWAQCQQNAHTNCRADTTLATPYGAYGYSTDHCIKIVDYDSYGSRMCAVRTGWRIQCNISNAWKSNAQLYKLEIRGQRSRFWNTGSPSFTYGGQYDDLGRMYFQYSEDGGMFTLGANAEDNFGEEDFYLDAVHLNNAQRAAGRSAWQKFTTGAPVYVELDKTYLNNMVGNDLYLWMMVPYWYDAYWVPQTYLSRIHWWIYIPTLYAYY